MRRDDDSRTSTTLLDKVANWRDDPAWARFLDKYDPLLRRWCREYGLDDDSVDEVCQRVWIELANRMKTFQYDPSRTFRGWLRRLCESRVIDFLRQRRTATLLGLDERTGECETHARGASVESDETDEGDGDPFRLQLLSEGEKVQASVKAKVKPSTWDAFWLVAVCDWTVEKTANELAMTRTAVYAARGRVAGMLCDEGTHVSGMWAARP
jgi:RNA polymerase sigma-70 factor (ECF subfamily)